jgi:hypothetical protein
MTTTTPPPLLVHCCPGCNNNYSKHHRQRKQRQRQFHSQLPSSSNTTHLKLQTQYQSTTAAQGRQHYGRCDCSLAAAAVTTEVTRSVHGEGDGGGDSCKNSYTARTTDRQQQQRPTKDVQSRRSPEKQMSRHKLEATRRIAAASSESVTPLQAINAGIVETSRATQNNSSK